MTDQPAKPAADAAKSAADSAKGFWAEKVSARYHAHGFTGAAKQSWGEVKDGINIFSEASKGKRAFAFGRVGAVGVGAYVASGAFQSKNADGTDRGALHRLGKLVVGGGIMAAGALAGGR